MKKTENYNLSQWDLTDPIKMDDFNSDNANIEAALTNLAALAAGGAQADALAAARAELEASIAAEKQRVDAELAKKASASDLSSAKSSLESAVSGKLARYVPLYTTYTPNSTVLNIPVSSLDLWQYYIVSLELSGLPDSSYMNVNGDSGTCFNLGGGSVNGRIATFSSKKAHVLMFPMSQPGNPISCLTFSGTVNLGLGNYIFGALSSLQIKSDSTISGPVTVRIVAIK